MRITKHQILAEIRRVAEHLDASALSMTAFSKHGKISISTVCKAFGSWNRAVREAGLIPYPSSKSGHEQPSPYTDEDLLQEIIRLTKELGKEPSQADMDRHGIATSTPFRWRWGSFAKAREEAYRRFAISDVRRLFVGRLGCKSQ